MRQNPVHPARAYPLEKKAFHPLDEIRADTQVRPNNNSLTLTLSQGERESLLMSSFSQGVALGYLLSRRWRWKNGDLYTYLITSIDHVRYSCSAISASVVYKSSSLVLHNRLNRLGILILISISPLLSFVTS